MSELRIGCVVMAAGTGRRFGGDKLDAVVDGKSLIRHALEAVPAEELSRVVVVTGHDEVKECAREFGFTVIDNPHPDWGQSYSIRLGLKEVQDCDAVLFQVADQPHLTRESVQSLVKFYHQHPDHIVALAHEGKRGNPCLFPAVFFPEIMALDGDVGGNVVIHHHKSQLLLWEVPERELKDIDTKEQLS